MRRLRSSVAGKGGDMKSWLPDVGVEFPSGFAPPSNVRSGPLQRATFVCSWRNGMSWLAFKGKTYYAIAGLRAGADALAALFSDGREVSPAGFARLSTATRRQLRNFAISDGGLERIVCVGMAFDPELVRRLVKLAL